MISLSANGFECFKKRSRLDHISLITRERDGYFERAARATLTRLRDLMHKPPFKDNTEAQSFLREAETLIEGQDDSSTTQ